MSELDKFPNELLNQPNEVRAKYFFDLTIGHPRLMRAFEELLRAIRQPFSGKLIFVYGPPGVGKTTLWTKIQKQILEQMLPQLEQDRGQIPFVGINLASPDSGIFSWRDFYKRFLLTIDEPLIEHKSSLGAPQTGQDGKLYLKIGSRANSADLRLVVEQTLKHRRSFAILIDEAQHLAKIASGRKLQDQLDSLKSLSNQTGVLIVLLGTYELLVFRNLSAQLSRRSIDIHFQRYHASNDDEITAFKSVLMTFQRHLPIQEEPNLLAQWDYFYERSIGCVGVLKEWLMRSLVDALEDGGRKLTKTHFSRYALSIAQCEKMLSDAKESELRMTETNEAYKRLRTGLGLEIDLDGESNGNAKKVSEDSVDLPHQPSKRPRRPGERNPKRDKTGK